MVHKLDRLSRSLIDTLFVLSDLSKQEISFISATEEFDFTTPIGKVLLALLAAFAQSYIDNLREETKKGKKERALKGLYNGSLPFGYQRVPKEQGGVPILHPTNVEGYRLAIRSGAEGRTVRELVHLLNAAGYRTTGNWGSRPFSQDTVLPMLKNRFYLGEISYKGTWMKGKHPAAIDIETWECCQEQIHRRLTKHETTKTTDRIYLLRKLLYCSTCGRPLRGQNRRGERRYRDPSKSYGEDCPEPQTTNADRLEKQIGDYLMQIRLPENWLPEAMQWIGEDGESARQGIRMREELQNKLEPTGAKLTYKRTNVREAVRPHIPSEFLNPDNTHQGDGESDTIFSTGFQRSAMLAARLRNRRVGPGSAV